MTVSSEVIGKTIPILPAIDLTQTLTFYEQLGFSVRRRYPDYAIVARGEMELHFSQFDEDHRHVAEHSGCYLRVSDARALYEEFRAKGVSGLGPLEEKPWGMREFPVIDPSGVLLRIGQPLS